MLIFGIDFRHAVEFSRIGRTPRFALSFEAPGQPAKHYCFVRGQSNRPLSSQSLCVFQRPNPAWGVIRLLEPSGSLKRPAAFASRTRSNKRNITDIPDQDANRGLEPVRAPLQSHQSPASPRGPVPMMQPPHKPEHRPRSVWVTSRSTSCAGGTRGGDGRWVGTEAPTHPSTAPSSRRLSASGRSKRRSVKPGGHVPDGIRCNPLPPVSIPAFGGIPCQRQANPLASGKAEWAGSPGRPGGQLTRTTW